MKNTAATVSTSPNRFEQLRFAREVITTESKALAALANRLDDRFCDVVELLLSCSGSVIVSGMGKAGLVGRKISATLASTGTRSHYLHPAEAIHGDLGRITAGDIVLMLSHSGETEEVTRILPSIAEIGATLVSVTARPHSTLAQAARFTLDLGPLEEACPHGLAPSTSTTAMLALGDALALVVSHLRGFGPDDFARYHPGGSLGKRLAKVEEVMRPLNQCRVATEDQRVRDVFVDVSCPGRRSGAIMLTGSEGKLTGIFTDSDLARLLERRLESALDGSIREVMTASPTTISAGAALSVAVEILAKRRISELPVVDLAGRPLGMIDITDVLGLMPKESPETELDEGVDRVGTLLSQLAGGEEFAGDIEIATSDPIDSGLSLEQNDDEGPATLPFKDRGNL